MLRIEALKSMACMAVELWRRRMSANGDGGVKLLLLVWRMRKRV
jgi:hypothetical protein